MHENIYREHLKKVYFASRKVLLKSLGLAIDSHEGTLHTKQPRIVVYGLRRLGDMVISLPAIEALREGYKDASIMLVATEYNKGIAAGPCVDEIIAEPSGMIGKTKLLSRLASYGFDIALDLTCDTDIFPAYALYRSGAKVRVGYDVEGRGVFYTRPQRAAFKGKHAAELLMDLVKASVGGPLPSYRIIPHYVPPSEEVAYAGAYRAEKALRSPLLGVHPGAYFPSQRWPVERFAQTIDELTTRGTIADTLVFGSSRDEKSIGELLGLLAVAHPHIVLNMPVPRFAALINVCDVFLCNNSGPLHLAAAMGVPAVSMMGPTDYDLWRPLGERNIVIRKNTKCSPCNFAKCKGHECMRMIMVREVINAVEKQLDGLPR